MCKNLFLILGIWLTATLTNGQDICIPWTPTYQLEWKDFKGPKIDSINGLAATCASIEVRSSYIGDSLTFKVTNNFLSNLSFVDYEAFKLYGDSLTDLLKHEQVHFDIAELHARIMRDELNKLIQSDTLTQENCAELVDSVHDLRNKMDSLYDYETFHGVIKSEQENWQLKVHELLKTKEQLYESNEITPHNKR